MTAESFSPYSLSAAQKELEEEARARLSSSVRAVDSIPLVKGAALDMTQLGAIPTVVIEMRARSRLARFEEIRDLHLLPSLNNPEVIYGKLSTGEDIFLSRYQRSFGNRRRVSGSLNGLPLSGRGTRRYFRRYISPLKERNKKTQ